MLAAGEPSGDALGARLIKALREEEGTHILFSGIGGRRMAEAGFKSLFPMEDLSVMGFAEVLPRAFLLKRRIRETANAALTGKPDALVTIDSPGFALRVAGRLKGQGIPLIHYVAPQVWAWRPGRAKRIAKVFDRVLALLPFEAPYFENEGLPCDFVGHSVVEGVLARGQRQERARDFRARHGIDPDRPVVLLLPGSRKSEVGRLHPIFCETAVRLRERVPELQIVLLTLPHVEEQVRDGVEKLRVPALVVASEEEKFSAFAAANAALAASGTVSLELAAAGVPTVVAYKVNPVSAWIGRRIIQVPWITLINIILDKALVPEFIQRDCRPDRLSDELYALLTDQALRDQQLDGAAEVMRRLGHGQEVVPSRTAARAILAAIERNP
jgi:lipid-A-disaccharide synthase